MATLGGNDFGRALGAIRSSVNNYSTWALAGTKVVIKEVERLGVRNLQARAGGGRWKRSKGRVYSRRGVLSWEVILRTPWMGMEWGGLTTNVYGNPFGTEKRREAGFPSMWAPWHRTTEKGYILGADWVRIVEKGDAADKVADNIMDGLDEVFDRAGLKRL